MEDSDGDTRLLVIGLDAACRPVLHPLFESGQTPMLRRLFERGVSGPLESQIPPWTGSAWPSMVTGKNPGKHGVFDFLTYDGYDWDVVNATHVKERPVWELLSDYGITSVVVNVPVTHPPSSFDGALIPGLTAPEDPECHPEGILEDVKAACGDYRVYPQSGPEPERSIEGYERTIELRGEAFRYLCDRFDPQFAFLEFQQTDSVFHERPGDKRAIEAVYRAVDREIADTVEAYDPDDVLIVSDHGIGPVEGHEFRINQFLRETGYLEGVQGGDGMPDWSTSWRNELLEGNGAGESQPDGPGALERAMNLAAKAGITTQRVARALDRVGLKEPIGRRVPNGWIRAASEQVDFPNSVAYVRSKSELGVRINLEGREPNGRVPESEYETVRNELIEELRAVRTPDDEPMFEAVEPRETFFRGPEIDSGPDVVTVPADFDNAIVAELDAPAFAEPWEPWNHKRSGVVAAVGSDFEASGSLAGATIFDVAPTICSVFDVPIDAGMDGTALPIVEETERADYPAYEPEPIVATDDGTVEDRLSDLGYL
ncbi:alkaline phosphatase family protein [Natrialbaceae archaeon GCM10025810]|uniref:alkaline phosphatase family protein n=1 Tax=Halovalidus salilacus TaxID=3075124 RepID=UPI00361B76D8